MTGSPTTHYLNSDFDLSLRPRPCQIGQPRLVRQVRELTAQALLGADDGDSALLRVDVPEEFLSYLAECGLPVPRLLRRPRIEPDAQLRPFGWNAEAVGLNRLHRRPVEHPALSSIRRVNSRSFALELESDLDPGRLPGTIVESPGAVESFLSRSPAPSEWVIKSEHGHAGLANRRVKAPILTPADRRFLDQRLTEDDRLLIEPWLPREHDACVVFGVPFEPSALRIHETVCTAGGGLIGALFDPTLGPLASWTDELGRMAERVAARLADAGYFGPVCVDAFSWRDGDRSRLRSLADLNCRLAMSDGAYRFWRQSGGAQTLYYRFFNRGKLALPETLPHALAALRERRYHPGDRRGILLASPLQVTADGGTWQPGKLAVIFAAEDRSAVFGLERWFRERFEV